jgi:hypothetical protein
LTFPGAGANSNLTPRPEAKASHAESCPGRGGRADCRKTGLAILADCRKTSWTDRCVNLAVSLTSLSRSSGTESGIVSATQIDEDAGILSRSGPCQKSEARAVVVGDGNCAPKTIAPWGFRPHSTPVGELAEWFNAHAWKKCSVNYIIQRPRAGRFSRFMMIGLSSNSLVFSLLPRLQRAFQDMKKQVLGKSRSTPAKKRV